MLSGRPGPPLILFTILEIEAFFFIISGLSVFFHPRRSNAEAQPGMPTFIFPGRDSDAFDNKPRDGHLGGSTPELAVGNTDLRRIHRHLVWGGYS